MTAEQSLPDDAAWLSALVRRSPLLPEAALRAHWLVLIDKLPPAARYELAGILMDVELACRE